MVNFLTFEEQRQIKHSLDIIYKVSQVNLKPYTCNDLFLCV